MFKARTLLRRSLPILLVLLGAGAARASDPDLDALKAKYRRPTEIPFPRDKPYSPQLATLGKMLFFDPRLSGAQNLSCASCHNPSFGFEVPVPGAIGAANMPLGRKASTVLNAAWTPVFFWDGRAKDLEEQALGPLTADLEMNAKIPEVLGRLKKIPEYRASFEKMFPGSGVTQANMVRAISTYERTVVAGWSPFDRWVEGDETAISDGAKRGFVLFNDKARCAGCHTGWNFTDNAFHDIGIDTTDIGRGKLEPKNPLAKHAFKTPGLRNLTYRAPFGHQGQFSNLDDIIAFYMTGGMSRPSKSPLIVPFDISQAEIQDLTSFLKTLTADQTETPLPNLPN